MQVSRSIRSLGLRTVIPFQQTGRRPLLLSPFRIQLKELSNTFGDVLPTDQPVEEDICPGYNSRLSYPVNRGEGSNNRYLTLVKVGWVWLARDIKRLIPSLSATIGLFKTGSALFRYQW